MAANTMKIDPFSTKSMVLEKSPETRSFSSSLIGFYLCSFDTTYGLQILYTIPPSLRKSSEEHDILKTHYIWKVEHIPMRIDLKISEFIYSALQLHESDPQSPDVSATVEKPIFGIVFKIWKDGELIHPDALDQFRNDLQLDYYSDIELLYKRQILKLNPAKRRKYLQLADKAAEIGKFLKSEWENLVNNVSNIDIFFESQKLTFPDSTIISSEREDREKNLFKIPITMRVLQTEESSEEVLVILVNQLETLLDVKIRVSKKTQFFSENLWEQDLEEWAMKEDIILEFPRSSKLESYMLKITSKNHTVAIKSLEIGPADTKL